MTFVISMLSNMQCPDVSNVATLALIKGEIVLMPSNSVTPKDPEEWCAAHPGANAFVPLPASVSTDTKSTQN